MEWWPLVWRRTADVLRLRLVAENDRRVEVERALVDAQRELGKHRMLLAGLSSSASGRLAGIDVRALTAHGKPFGSE